MLRRVKCAFARASGTLCIESLEERIALAVFVVTNANDSGAGSFRQAIRDANAGLARADTIVFDAGYFSVPREILVNNYAEQFGSVSGPLTVIGPGSSLLTMRAGNFANRVYARALDSFAPELTISGMTVTGGDTTANGGGLFAAANSNVSIDDMVFVNNAANEGGAIALANNATLTIRNSVITGNRAGRGGGIYFFSGGSLVMENTTVSGNTSTRASQWDASGGGIYFYGSARPAPLPAGFIDRTLLIRNSTISGNAGLGGGGGIALDWLVGTLLVRNSTISGNTAGTSGGGIYSINQPTTITVENSTITGNSSSATAPFPNAKGGGGIGRVSASGTINVINSVVSGNTNPASPDILSSPQTPTVVRYSAVGSSAGLSLSPGTGNNLAYGANLLLGPLAHNGGRTQTHLPQPGSPLIGAGSNALVPAELAFDQRGAGFPRMVGSTVDIGSVELPSSPPRVTRVFVNGTGWTTAFKGFLAAQGLGDATYGFGVPGGADQLKVLPWIGISRLSIRFSQHVVVGLSNLVVTGITVPNYVIGDFGYDPATFTATWYLAQPVRNDRLLLNLDDDAGGVADANGRLDGEWANGAGAFPSGNGVAGGDFRFAVNVLPGDADRAPNQRVATSDVNFVKARLNRSADEGPSPAGFQPYTIMADVDGNGRIATVDINGVKARLNTVLPPPPASLIASASLFGSMPIRERASIADAVLE